MFWEEKRKKSEEQNFVIKATLFHYIKSNHQHLLRSMLNLYEEEGLPKR